jgi:hypothetical protein
MGIEAVVPKLSFRSEAMEAAEYPVGADLTVTLVVYEVYSSLSLRHSPEP